jgi:hypothetical protein
MSKFNGRKHMTPLVSELVYWINEREAMRKAKEMGGKFPFSKDPVMANTRFTNVHREDDYVTKWIKINWRDPYASHPNMLVAMVLARMLNYVPSLKEVGFPEEWEPSVVVSKMREIKDRGDKLWSSAYTITTCGQKMAKEDYVVYEVCDEVFKWQERIFANVHTLHHAHQRLTNIDGLGSFLAAQVICDMKHVPGHPLGSAVDFKTWSAPGPGSLKGLSAFWGTNVTPGTYTKKIREAWELVKESVPEMSMQDFQNCFCEFSKYTRIKEGGHARNNYHPRT